MNKDINLADESLASKNADNKLFIYPLVIFIVCFLIAAFLLFYSLFLRSSASGLEKQAVDLRRQISVNSKQKETALIIDERLTAIKNSLVHRKKLDARVFSIMSTVPLSLQTQSIKADDNLISLTLSSASLADLESYLEGTVIRDKSPDIKRIDIASFIEKENGNYSLSLDYYFEKIKK